MSNDSIERNNKFEAELDHKHSTVIVDDLISATSDWRNIDDIVRLAFKALTDVVKV